MPPKKDKGPSNKTEQKKKQKIVEVCRTEERKLTSVIQDKTFGMKKTKKNMQYINQLQKSVSNVGIFRKQTVCCRYKVNRNQSTRRKRKRMT